jgi:hypothetical protein
MPQPGPSARDTSQMEYRRVAELAVLELGGLLFAWLSLRHLLRGAQAATRASSPPAAQRLTGEKSRVHLAVLAAIIAIGTVGRLAHLSQPMREDESWTYTYYASRSLMEGLSNYSLPNNHFLHTLLVHLSTGVFGGAPWAIRLPALVAGILLIPATFWLARSVVGGPAALIAAAAVAASAPLTLYSTNARGYTLTELLAMTSLIMVWSLSTDWDARDRWVALATSIALGMWVTPTMLFPACGALAWLVWISPRLSNGDRARWRGFVAASALLSASLTLMFYSPPLVRNGWRPLVSNPLVPPQPLGVLLRAMPSMLGRLRMDWSAGLHPLGSAIFIGGIIVAILSRRRESRSALRLAAAMISAAIVLTLLTRRMPETRMLLYLLPVLWVAAGAGMQQLIVQLAERTHVGTDALVSTIAIVMAAGLTYQVVASRAVLVATDTGTLPDARELVTLIQREERPGDYLVVKTPSGPPLVYYANRVGMSSEALYGSKANGGRLLVVVDEHEGQTLQSVLVARRDVTPDCSVPPRLLYRLPSVPLYEVQQSRTSMRDTSAARLLGCVAFAAR